MTKKREAVSTELSAYFAAMGRKGGKISGARRMENLSADEREQIAWRGAKRRWGKTAVFVPKDKLGHKL